VVVSLEEGEVSPVRLSFRSWGRRGAVVSTQEVVPREGPCVGAGQDHPDCFGRVAYAHDGIVEWWEDRVAGLEHGFTVRSRGDADSPLVVDIAVEGARVEVVGRTGARFVRPNGPTLYYRDLVAVDQRGATLPAWMERTSDGLRLVVDDRTAIGNVTIDPILIPIWSAESDAEGAGFGAGVAFAGDVNGDSHADVLVAAPGLTNPEFEEGKAFLYLGSQSGLDLGPAWSVESDQHAGDLGQLGPAGDVNADGYDDVIVGTPAWNGVGSFQVGKADVYLGSSSGLETTSSWTVEPIVSADFGASVWTAGDVDADGYDDVVVGSPEFDTGKGTSFPGRAVLYKGSIAGLETAPSWVMDGSQPHGKFGRDVSSAGDVNGDGYGDIVVGANEEEDGSNREGRAHVFLGSSTGLGATAAWTANLDQDLAFFGWSVASAGDVNNDGFDDVIVGAPLYDADPVANDDQGGAFLYMGSSAGLEASASWTAVSGQDDADFGRAVAAAGDMNGDGYDDICVGAENFDHVNRILDGQGAAFVYLGSASGLGSAPAVTLESDSVSGLGDAVSGGGDIDNDGYADLVVGAPAYSDQQIGEGRAYAYLGGSELGAEVEPPEPASSCPEAVAVENLESCLPLKLAWTGSAEDPEGASLYGAAVAGADVNGDGFSDVVVGAPWMGSDTESHLGKAYLYLGGEAGPQATAAWTVQSVDPGARLGASISSAGDVNADGFEDVVIGSPGADVMVPDYDGSVMVFHGSASGLDTVPSWTATPGQVNARLGASVATAGDVNGDGHDDVVVGANLYDADEVDEGRALVYLGSLAGLELNAAWTAESDQAAAQFGSSVSSAGDVDGDGFHDVVVGARYADSGTTDGGSIFVYPGGPQGLESTPVWTTESDEIDGELGWAVAGAGDVNGDGYSDVAAGMPHHDEGGVYDAGQGLLFFGSASGVQTQAAWTVGSDQDFSDFGAAIAPAGDMNADGYDDVVLGAPLLDGNRAFLYIGGPTGLAPTAAWATTHPLFSSFERRFGSAVAGAGDVNGDGYSDLVVGAIDLIDLVGEIDESDGTIFVYLGGIFDPDHDGVPHGVDLCPYVADPDQEDLDGDGVGDRCVPLALTVGEVSIANGVPVEVDDARPGEVVIVFLANGPPGIGPCPPYEIRAGLCLDLGEAGSREFRVRADQAGHASLTLRLPPSAMEGATVTIQAAASRGVGGVTSEPVDATVGP
jgi:hypothetical protein